MQDNQTKFKQPRAFYVICFTELWERFGYYGMQALFILYVSKVFLFSDDKSYSLFGAFAALVYATPLIGGYVGDQLIGNKRALVLGAALLVIGYGLLAVPMGSGADSTHVLFYLGLGFIVTGNGFFKTSPSSLLGKVYGPNSPQADSGFTLFYMSVNIGSFVAISLCGYVAHLFGWHVAFGMSSFGMFMSLVAFLYNRHVLDDVGSEPDFAPLRRKLIPQVGLIVAAMIIGAYFLFTYLMFTHWVLVMATLGALLFYAALIQRSNSEERRKLIACLILMIFAISFCCLYFQAPQSMNLFIDRNVNHKLLGFYIPTPSFQSFNPLWILALAPVLSHIYNRRQRQGKDLTIPTKFAVGIMIMGSGFLLLFVGTHFASTDSQISAWWVVLCFFLYSLGELLVSAIGLSMISQLAPPRYLAIMMGIWFLFIAISGLLSSAMAGLTSLPSGNIDPAMSLHIYGSVFAKFGLISLGVGLVALALVPTLKRLMGLTPRSAPVLEITATE